MHIYSSCVSACYKAHVVAVYNLIAFEPLVGFEPTTPRLQITCSGQLS